MRRQHPAAHGSLPVQDLCRQRRLFGCSSLRVMVMKIPATIALVATLACPAAAQEARGTKFGIAFKPIDAVLSKTRKRVEITGAPSQDEPRYYRLRIKVTNPGNEDWSIVIRASTGQVLSAFDQKASACETDAGCWTRRLNSKLPAVQLSTQSANVRAEVVDGLYMPSQVASPFYSPMPGNTNELLAGLSFPNTNEKVAMQTLADDLGMLIGSGPGIDGKLANWCCSGTRLTSDLFMTNWHCGGADSTLAASFWQGGICHSAIVDMSWDSDDEGREYACQKVEFSSEDLDVAIIRLTPLADGPALSRPLLLPKLNEEPLTAGESVTVLHHPACVAKSVTRGCSVLNPNVATWTGPEDAASITEFTHNCTTENGSSGGPVFASDGRIIGLHHLGVGPMRMEPGNFAVNVAAILMEIKRTNDPLYKELMAATSDP
ncbi:serine protease (plasmid) [Rhizobium leguminosarum]|nr:serine protease [Rhizobium leguminosarum]